MAKNRQIKNRIENFLELPQEIISEVPKVTLIGFNQILVENYKGIIEYDENYIRLSTSIGNIIIQGMDLNLNQITTDDIEVKGKIVSIELLEIES